MILPEVHDGLLGDVVPADRLGNAITYVAQKPASEAHGSDLIAELAVATDALAPPQGGVVVEGLPCPLPHASIAEEVEP